ncbi:hypothetical protein ABZP36_015419 [Zizania latifolia]
MKDSTRQMEQLGSFGGVDISPRPLFWVCSLLSIVAVDEDEEEDVRAAWRREGGSHKAGGGAGEVRRINVVYFLSRGGRTDHPHLFRVNHLHRAGVRLRDVKRWLSELRGKDMPDNFSWSYKRKYKAGYIWQDLMDDDLITPISDNEFVLKGCDVRGAPPPCAEAPKEKSFSLGHEKKLIDSTEEKAACGRKQVEEVLQVTASNSGECSLKTSPSTDHDLPVGEGEAASRTVPFKVDLSQGLHEEKHQQQQQQEAVVKGVSKAVVARAVLAEEQVQGAAGVRAQRMRVAKMLHSLLTCGTADTDEAALHPVLRQRAGAGAGDDWPRTPVCPGMDGCGLRVGKKVKVRRGGKDKAKPKRDGGDAHRPASLPRCSQCGKEFKPHELHSHMQSCRGLREKMRSSTSARTSSSVDRNRSSAARHEHRRAGRGAAAGDTPALFLTGS